MDDTELNRLRKICDDNAGATYRGDTYEAAACNALPRLLGHIADLERDAASLEKRIEADRRAIQYHSEGVARLEKRLAAAEDEVKRLESLREKDATAVLALHHAAGGDKGLSSADLLEYTRLAMQKVRAEVRRQAMDEAASLLESCSDTADVMRKFRAKAKYIRECAEEAPND